jgi:hypothetical protein
VRVGVCRCSHAITNQRSRVLSDGIRRCDPSAGGANPDLG